MKTISNTLEVIIGRWDDPGDYPNAVAAGPLPSYDYVEDVEGELILELTDEELILFNEDIELFLHDDIECKLENVNILDWLYKIEGNCLTLECLLFETCGL